MPSDEAKIPVVHVNGQWQLGFLLLESGSWFNINKKKSVVLRQMTRESVQNSNFASTLRRGCLSLVESYFFISLPTSWLHSLLGLLRLDGSG